MIPNNNFSMSYGTSKMLALTWFNSNSNKTTAFQTIWGNDALRGSLFTNITNEIEAFSEFELLINNTNSQLYNFIKIE